MSLGMTIAQTLSRHDLDNLGRREAYDTSSLRFDYDHRKAVIRDNAISAVLTGASALPVPVVPMIAGGANMLYGSFKLVGGLFFCLGKALLGNWVKAHMSEGTRLIRSGALSMALGAASLVPGVGQIANGAVASSMLGAALVAGQIVNGVAAVKDVADIGGAILAPKSVVSVRPGS